MKKEELNKMEKRAKEMAERVKEMAATPREYVEKTLLMVSPRSDENGDYRMGGIGSMIRTEDAPPVVSNTELAMSVLKDSLHNNPEFRKIFGADLAGCYIDAFGKTSAAPVTKDRVIKVANEAANRFIHLLETK